MTLDAATGPNNLAAVTGDTSPGAQTYGLRVPLPILFIGLMILVIFSVFDILDKTYDANLVANRRVAKAVLDGAMRKADAELDGLALGLAAGYSAADPQRAVDLAGALSGGLADRSAEALVVFLDGAGQPLMILRGGEKVSDEQFAEVAGALPFSTEPRDVPVGAESAARFISMSEIVYLLSSRYRVTPEANEIGATGLVIGLPAEELLRKELERYEIFRSGSMKELLDSAQTDGFKSVADLIIETQRTEYREFQLNVVAQVVTVLVAFIICVMIARRIDEKNDALRDSYGVIAEREQEARRQRDRAENASEAKSRLIANMSHELRTPLNGILGYAEMISSEVFGKLEGQKARYREYAENIHTSGTRLQNELSQILEFSDMARGGTEPDREPVDFENLAREVADAFRGRADNRGIKIRSTVEDGLPAYKGDRSMLSGMLQHLLSNAVKFGKDGGQVEICMRFSESSNAIEMRVKDDGIGMDQHSVIPMFEPFSQGEDVYARDHQGTGLGLALAKCYAAAHGAAISVRTAPGEGTLIIVHLPLPEEKAADSAAAGKTPKRVSA